MMPTSFWISAATVSLTATLVLTLQSARNRELREQLHLAGEPDTRSAETGTPAKGTGSRIPAPEQSDGAAGSATSEERIAAAHAEIHRLFEDTTPNDGPAMAEHLRRLPDALRAVVPLTTGELVALADRLGTPSGDPSTPNPGNQLQLLLYTLAGEQDPRLVLRNNDAMRHREVREAVLRSLAGRDPDAARKWLLDADLSETERRDLTTALAYVALSTDIDAGLAFLRAANPGDNRASFSRGPALVPDATLPDLVAALDQPENADLRTRLLAIAVDSAVHHHGIEGARARVEQLGIAGQDIAPLFLQGALSPALEHDPATVLAWMRDIQTPAQWEDSLPTAIDHWARHDFNAAGTWLGSQDPSPARDTALARFSNVVAEIDPRAAIVWAGEITDPSLRTETVTQAAERWMRTAPEEASQWLDDAGIDPANLPSTSKPGPSTTRALARPPGNQ